MQGTEQAAYLDFFSRVAMLYQKRYAGPLWARYPNATTSIRESLGFFLEGYAFERQGRAASFSAVAADVIAEMASMPLDPAEAWRLFKSKIASDKLNIKNNPIAPRGTAFTHKGKPTRTGKDSAIELANALGAPLVQWALHGLKEDQVDEIHSRICGVTGVGSKIASFFLRDVASRYQAFPSASRSLLQPIDIWVERSAGMLGASDRDTARFIVEYSRIHGHEPEKVNQGMWYFGAEIAGSEYTLTQALTDRKNAEVLLSEHVMSFSQAAAAVPPD